MVQPLMKTNEKAQQYDHSFNHCLEFFSKAGSLMEKKKAFYGNEATALELFKPAWIADNITAFKLLLWLRDARGGAGNRSAFRTCLRWVAEQFPEWVYANLSWIPMVGRWDDLRTLFGTNVGSEAAKLWAHAIRHEDILAAKWADRSDKLLQGALNLNEANLRRLLASIRKNSIVEHKMCTKDWSSIEYKKVPSVAMARYTKAFGRNDTDRFEAYKAALVKGETTVNASVLFPHDCVRTVKFGDSAIADAQFDTLPNYMENSGEKAIVICDTSGSMESAISGKIAAIDVSQALALYCSAKISPESPFYKKFIAFCSEGEFKNWNSMTFSQAVKSKAIFNGAVGATRIDKALDLILNSAVHWNIKPENMLTTLIIVSDMQFTGGVAGGERQLTEIQKCMFKWRDAGYNIPKIIYWNTAGYAGSVETKYGSNIALVSGFSPSVLKAIFNGDDLTPEGVMKATIKKYEITIPK
jgi:hypothetical protein